MSKLSQEEILRRVAAGTMSPEEALKATQKPLSVEKYPPKDGKDVGTIGIKGIRRFPVAALYPGEWKRLLEGETEDGTPILDAIRAAVEEVEATRIVEAA